MARFRETVNIQPVATGTGAAQGLSSLADRLESFKQQAGGIAIQRAQERGLGSAGQVELEREGGVTQAPEVKEKKFIGSIEISAHNKALRAAYLASLDNDIRSEVGRIKNENPDNLIKFNEAVAGFSKGIMGSVDPGVRQLVAGALDDRVSGARLSVQAADIKKQNDIAKEEITGNVASAAEEASRTARNGDKIAAAQELLSAFQTIDGGIESDVFTPKEGAELKRIIEKDATEQSINFELDQLAGVSFKDAFDRVEELNKKVPKGWTPDEWREFIISAQQDINRKQARAKEDVKKISKEIKLQDSIDRGMFFINPNIPADPAKGSQDRKDVNNAYGVVAKEWIGLPPLEQFNNNIEFIKNTGIMPDKMISGINSSMRSGTPDQVFVFSTLLNEITKDPNSANILRDVPDESRAMAKHISDSLDSGIELEIATEIARKKVYGLTEPERERIKIETQAKRKDMSLILEDLVDKEFDPSPIPFFGEEPALNSAIQADFNVSFDKFMTLTDGDSDQASILAFEGIKKVWGVNDLDGNKRFMKYAPSVFYSVQGVDDDWMEDQYEFDMESLGFKVKNTIIAVDKETTDSSEPSFPIMTIDEDGRFNPLFDETGKALRWKPDFSITKEFTKLRSAPARKTKKALELRQRMNKLNTILGVRTEEGT